MATNVERIKWVEGTAFLVDGFSYTSAKCQHYFLTHFHSDHTWGLRPSFSAGTIYCSEPTAALLIGKLGVQPQFVQALPLRKPTWIQGVEVTLLCANHCPGAVQFLFRIPTDGTGSGSSSSSSKKRPLRPWEGKATGSDGTTRRFRTILHTGDCRAAPEMVAGAVAWLKGLKEEEEGAGKGGAGLVDVVYLDTTYCNPKHMFPSQPEALAAMARIAQQERARDPQAVFYVGCYSIGKERAVRAVAEAIGSKVYADERKERVLLLAGEWDDALFSREVGECAVRMSWLGRLRPDRLKRETVGSDDGVKEEEEEEEEEGEGEDDEPRWEEVPNEEEEEEEEEPEPERAARGNGQQPQQPRTVVGFRPTGWCYTRASKAAAARGEYRPWVDETGRTRLYCVPYSEHSSFPELQAYVRALKPRRIIPTVNAGDAGKVEKMLRHFLKDMDLSHDKGRLDAYFNASSSASFRSSQTTTKTTTTKTATTTTTTGAGVVKHSSTSTAASFFSRRNGVVDLAAVDVEEQERLWAALAKKAGKEQEEEDGDDEEAVGVGWETVEDEEEAEEEKARAAASAAAGKAPPAVITIDDSDSD